MQPTVQDLLDETYRTHPGSVNAQLPRQAARPPQLQGGAVLHAVNVQQAWPPPLTAAEDALRINVVIQDQARGREATYRVLPHAPFGAILDAFAWERGVEASHMLYLLNGERLSGDQTPATVGFKVGDIVLARIEACD